MYIRSETPVVELALRELPPSYRQSLLELRSPPASLFVRGRLSAQPRLGVVGTRAADPEALRFTQALCERAAATGWTVVSGGALGIDAAAHAGVLAGGGQTIVVLASTVRYAFPKVHHTLFERAVNEGALVSEFDDGRNFRGRFLQRNRIIAALSDILVVVQAPYKSGALSTAAAAKRLGRRLVVVPASPWDPRGDGCRALLQRGAEPLHDIRALLPSSGSSRPPAPVAARSAERPSELADAAKTNPLGGLSPAAELWPLARPAAARAASTAEDCSLEAPVTRSSRPPASGPPSSRPPSPSSYPPLSHAPSRRGLVGQMSPAHAVVLAALSIRPRHADEIQLSTQLDGTTVARLLLELVLDGVAAEREGGRFVRVT